MRNDFPSSALERYFSGLTEFTFQTRLGVADPSLTDYLSQLLIAFLRNDTLYSVRDGEGRRLARIGEMLGEAERRMGSARREVHRHIGDFALFWVGLFPEALRLRDGQPDEDRYEDYCSHGKRAYYLASEIETDRDPPGDVLERLSCEFEMCAYGLREVRREWEERDGSGGMMLIR